uniref:Chromo domain-containing protein n=1 Tax=Ananas comosus var. bracteatus TaxID=296719 RepID=A0A6V7PER8_ANACO|nr:unnamed protein product [Ananas comosus var. bracteatus]
MHDILIEASDKWRVESPGSTFNTHGVRLVSGANRRLGNALRTLGLQKLEAYDVILGMDWLSKYHATIDCKSRVITIREPRQEDSLIGLVRARALLRRCRRQSKKVEFEPVDLQENTTYEEYPVCILDREVKELRNRTIPYVKVQWSDHSGREATWELGEAMRESYPHLFDQEN